MMETIKNALKVKEIRQRLWFTFFMLILVRLGTQIPIPFVNQTVVQSVMENNFASDAFSFFSTFTGGSMERMSLFSLNITPYITAQIILQLLTIAIPKLEEMQKDGEEGRKKMVTINRYLTVGLAIIEAVALVVGFAHQGVFDTETLHYADFHAIRKWGAILSGVLGMTAGSAVLMWIGERITDKGVGNGISMVLAINIISRMPSDIAALYTNFVTKSTSIGGKVLSVFVITAIIVAIVVLVVILQGAIRRIAVQMSQKVQGRRQVGAQQSSIPLRVNTAGVIPVIFASSLLQFPVVIASFFGKKPEWTNYLSQSYWCNPGNMKYSIGFIVYILLILFFAYFYTSITFNPREVAKNLADRGGFITGIRSGKPTVAYLSNILNKIIFIGAVGLIIVAVIPIIASGVAGANVSFGGTSIIIVVGVILETLQTIKSMSSERSYSRVSGIF